MGPVKLIERAAGTAVQAARHPLSSAAYAAGIARGLVGAVLHGATVTGHDDGAGLRPVPTQREAGSASGSAAATATPSPATTAGPPEPQRVLKPVPEPGDLPEPIVIEPRDEEPGESFATEPKAVSRDSAHGGSDVEDAEVDGWDEEAQDGPDADAGADLRQAQNSEVLDPGVAKAVRSESEMLRRAAGTSTD